MYGLNPFFHKKVVDYWLSGETQRDIARATGRCPSTIRKILLRYCETQKIPEQDCDGHWTKILRSLKSGVRILPAAKDKQTGELQIGWWTDDGTDSGH